jgi:hypothetical protein
MRRLLYFKRVDLSGLGNLEPPAKLIKKTDIGLAILKRPECKSRCYPAIYRIENDRIDTAEKLVCWLRHLSETKAWWTNQHAVQLIDYCAQHYGIKRFGT